MIYSIDEARQKTCPFMYDSDMSEPADCKAIYCMAWVESRNTEDEKQDDKQYGYCGLIFGNKKG